MLRSAKARKGPSYAFGVGKVYAAIVIDLSTCLDALVSVEAKRMSRK